MTTIGTAEREEPELLALVTPVLPRTSHASF